MTGLLLQESGNDADGSGVKRLFFWLLVCGTGVAARAFPTTITEVLSGDIVVTNEGVRLHLEGIEAPEMPRGQLEGQPFAEEARNMLLQLMEGQTVSVYVVYRDGEGMLYAIIEAPSGNVAEVLAANGLAYPTVNSDRFSRREIDRCAESAQERRAGIWSLAQYDPPWRYRERYRISRL
jgi:endonuclease YncB( thermonuclease family)